MNHAIALSRYLEAMTQLWPKLSEDEQQAFHQWRCRPTSKRNSDWPGWIKYLGTRPGSLPLQEIKRSA